MKLTFLGAAHEVTGSCFLLEAAGKRILIDCGSEQGKDLFENPELPVAPGELDALLLTHAHVDHSGKIPLLVKNGYKSPVYATNATTDLCGIMLLDCAHINEAEAEYKNRKNKRAGLPLEKPLYGVKDAEAALKLFRPVAYGAELEIFEGITIHFTDVGHLLGSASITVLVTENGTTKRIVFSGDIGNLNQPILKNPSYLNAADYVIMESTYGDRSHSDERPDTVVALAEEIQKAFDKGGNVVIPSFAVGRTQEMLYHIRKIKEQNLVTGHGNWPVYIDSPLAVSATKIVSENYVECFDEEAMQLIQSGINPLDFPGLTYAVTSEESKLINFDETPKVIISASGMCTAGRIRHHLKHNLWRPESTILFVGFQSNGTLGRMLVEGVNHVTLFGEKIEVKANIVVLPGMSGHADDRGLLAWASHFDPKPASFFVVHGEDTVTDLFAARLHDEFGFTAIAPYPGASYDLLTGECLNEGNKEHLEKQRETEGGKKQASLFSVLRTAGERLLAIIRRSEGRPNKELSAFAEDINNLCDKWNV